MPEFIVVHKLLLPFLENNFYPADVLQTVLFLPLKLTSKKSIQ